MVDQKKRCFVVGPIGSVGTHTRNKADMLLEYIIRPALEELGYSVDRADDSARPGMITDHVINSVLDADLVVADLTGPNANAFYELGIRHREQKPVIHMIDEEQRPPFDVAGFNTIFFRLDNPKYHREAIEALTKHASAIQEDDYRVTNPITSARGHQHLAQSANNMEQMVAMIYEMMTSHERRLDTLEAIGRTRRGGILQRPRTILDSTIDEENKGRGILNNPFFLRPDDPET